MFSKNKFMTSLSNGLIKCVFFLSLSDYTIDVPVKRAVMNITMETELKIILHLINRFKTKCTAGRIYFSFIQKLKPSSFVNKI